MLLISSFTKPRLPFENPKNTLRLRVLPNDIDLNMHMNNGRYLTICDLTRVDMFIRTGLAKTMIKEKWIPVISEHTMKYKKGLKLFQKYDIYMEVTGWDDKAFQMIHTFIVNDRVVAEGTSRGVIVSKQGVIPPDQVMKQVNIRINNIS
jgi:acyl-CoA thioesterase FadM